MTASLDMPALPRRVRVATDPTINFDRALDLASHLPAELPS
jgi:hypothetical protein